MFFLRFFEGHFFCNFQHGCLLSPVNGTDGRRIFSFLSFSENITISCAKWTSLCALSVKFGRNSILGALRIVFREVFLVSEVERLLHLIEVYLSFDGFLHWNERRSCFSGLRLHSDSSKWRYGPCNEGDSGDVTETRLQSWISNPISWTSTVTLVLSSATER